MSERNLVTYDTRHWGEGCTSLYRYAKPVSHMRFGRGMLSNTVRGLETCSMLLDPHFGYYPCSVDDAIVLRAVLVEPNGWKSYRKIAKLIGSSFHPSMLFDSTQAFLLASYAFGKGDEPETGMSMEQVMDILTAVNRVMLVDEDSVCDRIVVAAARKRITEILPSMLRDWSWRAERGHAEAFWKWSATMHRLFGRVGGKPC